MPGTTATLEKADSKDREGTQQDWLSNPSFRPEDAAAIHLKSLRKQEDTSEVSQDAVEISDTEVSSQANSVHTLNFPDDIGNPLILTCSSSDEDITLQRPEKHSKRKKKEKKKKKKKHKKESHKHRSDEKYIDQNRGTKNEQVYKLSATDQNKIFIDDIPNLKPENAFRIDRRKDNNSLQFGELYKMHIARYRNLTRFCLGTINGKTISLEVSKRSTKTDNKDDRYFCRHSRAMIKMTGLQLHPKIGRLKQKRKFTDTLVKTEDEFILLDKDTCMEHKREAGVIMTERDGANPLGVYDTATALYIQGQGLTTRDSQPDSSDSKAEYIIQAIAQKEMAEFNQQLNSSPHDISLWLKFIDFTKNRDNSNNMQKSTDELDKQKPSEKVKFEIIMSIFDKALAKNPGNVKLEVSRIKHCEGYWDKEKQADTWKNLVFRHPNDAKLWWWFLQSQQHSLGGAGASGLVKLYGRCLVTLTSVLNGSLASHPPKPNALHSMSVIVVKLCEALRQAGHMERAVALYQCMLEYNLRSPQAVNILPHADKIDFLEAFWDSGTGRLGEPGATGWEEWVEKKGQIAPVQCLQSSKDDDEALEEDLLTQANGVTDSWMAVEMARTSRHWLPWRPDDSKEETEDDCEDPERLVLFDDLKKCVFIVDNEEEKFFILCSFLMFLGVPLRKMYPQCCTPFSAAEEAVYKSDVFGVHLGSSVKGGDFPFKSHYQNAAFALNVISQSRQCFSDKLNSILSLIMAKYKHHIMWEGESDIGKKKVKEVRKFVKNLLKEGLNRNSLLMWEFYARVEWTSGAEGAVESARNILNKAISLAAPKISNITNQRERCLASKLYRSYAELELAFPTDLRDLKLTLQIHCSTFAQSHHRVTRLMCSLVDGAALQLEVPVKAESPIRLLKCRKLFEEYITTELNSLINSDSTSPVEFEPFADHVFVNIVVCYSLLQYSTVGIEGASYVYETNLRRLHTEISQKVHTDDSSIDRDIFDIWTRPMSCVVLLGVYELLTEAYICLLHGHARHSCSSLSVLREPVQRAVLLLPDNQDLVCLLATLPTGGAVWKLKRQLYQVTLRAYGTAGWLAGVMAESRRLETLQKHQQPGIPMESGIINQLRAWFEKSVTSHTAARCVLLWRLYFHFEVHQGNLVAAEAVYYRSLQQCPLVKILYIDYINFFPKKLQHMTDMMTEKELRVHLPIEELTLLRESLGMVEDIENVETLHTDSVMDDTEEQNEKLF